MRMSSFLVGSMLGMVGAVMLMQRKSSVAQAVQSAVSDLKGNVVGKAVSKITKSMQQQAQGSQQQSSSSSSSSPSNHQMNVSMIEGIINSDPELQSTVEEIKHETSSVKH